MSALIVLSYLFNIISGFLKIPSVLLLITTGIALNYGGRNFGFHYPDTQFILELLGIIGLIFIVLEGSLDLELHRNKIPLISRALIAALIILLATTAIITFLLEYTLQIPLRNAMIYAVPMGVISSAIAIPSVTGLSDVKKEFLIYESTFSDIIGIMLFNYVVLDSLFTFDSLGGFLLGILMITLTSIGGTGLIIIFLNKTSTKVRFYLIFAFLILIYAGAKLLHLPSLLVILVFGLTLNNTHIYIKGKLAQWLHPEVLKTATKELKLITIETAFIVRTYFFLLFGYSINLMLLKDQQVWITGGLIVSSIIVVRFIFLRFISKTHVFPELFIAPRGLITIILFYSIPHKYKSELFNEGILLFVIIISSLLMMLGLLFSGKNYEKSLDQP
ncbi:MAG: hypothetical protein Fur0041_17910 [Bacteroidia bacterium]